MFFLTPAIITEETLQMKNIEKAKLSSFLTFNIGEELYASNVKNVINIIELSKITKVPKAPEYMLGIVNLRGMVLPIVDTRKKFGLQETEFTVNTCILVLEVIVSNQNILVGALVDGVKEVIEIGDEEIMDPPSIGFSFDNNFITGVFKKKDEEAFIMILDMDCVFSTDEILAITQHVDKPSEEVIEK
jgi:purine-binding chemotaxis protein CheW